MNTSDLPTLPARFDVRETLALNNWQIMLRAWDSTMGREVVLQLPGDAYRRALDKPHHRERIVRQARNLARIKHPCVAMIHEVLDVPHGPILVLEATVGESLEKRLQRRGGTIPAGEVLDIAGSLGVALEAVHAASIVHRNIAAENVFLRPDGSVALAGFLFSKILNPSASTSFQYPLKKGEADAALPAFPAPEVAHGQSADARSDIFGLGCVLYQCLSGRSLGFEQITAPDFDPEELLQSLRDEDAGRRTESGPLAPTGPGTGKLMTHLIEILSRCLAVSPLARYQSAREFCAAVELACGDAMTTIPTSASRRPGLTDPTSRSPGPMEFFLGSEKAGFRIASAVAVVSLLVLIGFVVFKDRETPVLNGGEGNSANERGNPLRTSLAPDPVGAFDTTYANSHALLIGIGRAYARTDFRALPNPERDVEAIATRLREMTWENWNVTVLEGPAATYGAIRRALEDLSLNARENDRVFIYYAGHGERHPKTNESGWIIPADAIAYEQDKGRSNWLRFDDLGKFYVECAAKHIMIALDCCYSGIGVQSTKDAGSRGYRKTYLTRKAHLLFSSSRENQAALDGPPNGHSPFAEVLLAALKEEGRPMTTSELMVRTQKYFVEEDLPQVPMLGHVRSSDQSEFVFFRQPDVP